MIWIKSIKLISNIKNKNIKVCQGYNVWEVEQGLRQYLTYQSYY